MKREVAAGGCRFFRGECPIQETGRQSRLNKILFLTRRFYRNGTGMGFLRRKLAITAQILICEV
jgi:hypothetical protein